MHSIHVGTRSANTGRVGSERGPFHHPWGGGVMEDVGTLPQNHNAFSPSSFSLHLRTRTL